jgi:hypothetical protein
MHYVSPNFKASWREDNRRVANGDQAGDVAAFAMGRGWLVDFGGYWRRHKQDT